MDSTQALDALVKLTASLDDKTYKSITKARRKLVTKKRNIQKKSEDAQRKADEYRNQLQSYEVTEASFAPLVQTLVESNLFSEAVPEPSSPAQSSAHTKDVEPVEPKKSVKRASKKAAAPKAAPKTRKNKS